MNPRAADILIRRDGRTVYIGRDATAYFSATVLAGFIDLYLETGYHVTSGEYTPAKMARHATRYTGKAYSVDQLAQASADIAKWASAMRLALSVVNESGEPCHDQAEAARWTS